MKHPCSNTFSFPLHNVFDSISSEELPLATPMFEIVSPVGHDELHDMEHNHSCPQELVDSPKGAHEHIRHSSIVEHDDVHEVSVESP